MVLKNPKKLRERDTDYDFLRFWEPDSKEECYENNGSSSPNVMYPANLRGLYVECSHWMCRGNSFGKVRLKNLADYVAKYDDDFRKNIQKISFPDLTIIDWLKKLYQGDKKLRRQIGLDKVDIFQRTFVLSKMRTMLGIKENLKSFESLVNKVRKGAE